MSANPGIVYLVGAGPGDPGLMTTRSLELIVAADVIVHDRLIPGDALALARPDAELIYVGKEPGAASLPQEGIAELLIDRARQGKLVVRLKGGDPFVFGRGGEEAEALADAGHPLRGRPRGHRRRGGPRLRRHPGHPPGRRLRGRLRHRPRGPRQGRRGRRASTTTRWPLSRDARPLHGRQSLPRIAERLIDAGRDAAEPAAVVERGTLPGQRTVSRALGDIAAASRGADIRAAGRHHRRRGRRPARAIAWVRAPPAARQEGGRHPRPGAGERAVRGGWRRWAPSPSSCRPSGSSPGSTPTRSAHASSALYAYATRLR